MPLSQLLCAVDGLGSLAYKLDELASLTLPAHGLCGVAEQVLMPNTV